MKNKVGRPFSSIDVPQESFDFWDKHYEVGDFTKISIGKNICRPTINKAWWKRKASQENIDKITAFYRERLSKKALLEQQVAELQVAK